MIVTYNWLKEFVDIDLPAQEVADLLTMQGLEVERVETLGAQLDSVIVARVEERTQHPNADKLSLCRVNTGSAIINVVCGAPNVHTGATVALAQVGSVLPGDFRIKKSKIRGEESEGMLCSERELGLSEESSGIMLLPAEYPLGVPLFEAMGIKDTVFEIGLTPNRPDCLSVIGVAREVAAKLGKPLRFPEQTPEEQGGAIAEIAAVEILDDDLCPRYMARCVSGCTIGPSPAWLVNRLTAVGIRSINNIVDITNYVMMEYGHPLHAFDRRFLDGGRIIVRRAAAGEKMETLDGAEREFTADDLLICDARKPVAIAGIMGGEHSGIADDTVDILLESAWFNPGSIRRTSRRLGLHTESSHRFERGADIGILPRALDRAAFLVAELAGGTVATGAIDVYPRRLLQRRIPLRTERVSEIVGMKIEGAESADILSSLGFLVEHPAPGLLDVTVPTARVDIEREIDLIEEVARLKGYDAIPASMPVARVVSDRPPLHQRVESQLRDLMVAAGYNEVVNFSFISEKMLSDVVADPADPRREAIPLRNPLSEDQAVMRTTLLPGLLAVASQNINRRVLDLRIFELGRAYFASSEEPAHEPRLLTALLTGNGDLPAWNRPARGADFFDIKGVAETVAEGLGIKDLRFQRESEAFFHPGKSCTLLSGGTKIGILGEVHPEVAEAFDINQPVYYLELDFDRLVKLVPTSFTAVAPSRFPDTFRDAALLVSVDVPADEILRTVREVRAKELADVEVFDLYTGAGIPEGMKSVAIRVRYRSMDRTLTDDEVSAIQSRIISSLSKKLQVTIR